MSGKVRVYEVAKQLNLEPKQVVGLFQAIGIAEVRNHMSSVDPEAVERVKRHLEKQRTHDVVEERIRSDGRVIKRRAIAKPGASVPAESAPPEPPSSATLPTAAPSVRALDELAAGPEHNGHAVTETILPLERETPRTSVPEDRASARSLEPAPASMRDRPSVKSIPSEPSLPSEPAPAPSARPTDDTVAAASPAPALELPPAPAPIAPPPMPAPPPAAAAPPPAPPPPATPAPGRPAGTPKTGV